MYMCKALFYRDLALFGVAGGMAPSPAMTGAFPAMPTGGGAPAGGTDRLRLDQSCIPLRLYTVIPNCIYVTAKVGPKQKLHPNYPNSKHCNFSYPPVTHLHTWYWRGANVAALDELRNHPRKRLTFHVFPGSCITEVDKCITFVVLQFALRNL